jgi:predicted nucleic-acid-binding protein
MASGVTSRSAMRAVDTNVLVRLLTRDDAKQVSAAEEYVANGAWVSHLTLAEAVWVLDAVYERDRQGIATAVEMLLNHVQLSIQDADAVAGALLEFRSHARVGFTDCLMIEIARKAGHLPLGTFDRDLAKVDGAQRL